MTRSGAATRPAGPGWAESAGLPTQYTLIVDPARGALLGYEAMLTTTAGKLDVRVPDVVGYQTYVTTAYGAAPAR